MNTLITGDAAANKRGGPLNLKTWQEELAMCILGRGGGAVSTVSISLNTV